MKIGKVVSLERLFEILDSGEFYDLLPGDGQDDRIIDYLKRKFEEAASAPKN